MSYHPKPIDTTKAALPESLLELTERLAEHIHDVWARRRLSEGWSYGPLRDNLEKKHPGLVPYPELSESEKEYDRATAMETLKAVITLGYQIGK